MHDHDREKLRTQIENLVRYAEHDALNRAERHKFRRRLIARRILTGAALLVAAWIGWRLLV